MSGARCIVATWFIIATTAANTCLCLYTERLAEAGIEPSVGSLDDSYDNALAESINER